MIDTLISNEPHGRIKKFTPERMEQIRNLVERGWSRDQIAEAVGCTVGSLQVTCSRHGLSLRKSKITFPYLVRGQSKMIEETNGQKQTELTISLILEYHGTKRTIPIVLSKETVTSLALEASMRDEPLSKLLTELLTKAVGELR